MIPLTLLFRDLKCAFRHYSLHLPKYGIPYSQHQIVTVSNRSNLSTVELGGLYHVATINGLELGFRISMHNFFSLSIDRSRRGEKFTLDRT